MSRSFQSEQMDITAGEYLRAKKQQTIYTSIERAAQSISSTNHQIKWNTRYKLQKDQNNKISLRSAGSHEALLDISKGKQYANPVLDGYTTPTSNRGNFKTYTPSAEQILTYPIIQNSLEGHDISLTSPNTIPATKATYSYMIPYPKYILDPYGLSNEDICGDNSSASDDIMIDFRWSTSYWNSIKGQSLDGLIYPTKLTFLNQATDQSTDIAQKFAPLATTNTDISNEDNIPQNQYAKWCKVYE